MRHGPRDAEHLGRQGLTAAVELGEADDRLDGLPILAGVLLEHVDLGDALFEVEPLDDLEQLRALAGELFDLPAELFGSARAAADPEAAQRNDQDGREGSAARPFQSAHGTAPGFAPPPRTVAAGTDILP